MANVAHSTLTGADLHEPKGISTAGVNTVYVANGAGSGTWSSSGVLLGTTGQIADFATPSVPVGWLECDGSTVNRGSFASLFTAVTIQQTGSRTASSAIITGLTSTSDMRAGYFIGGTGIPNGTTILTVDSATQVTMSANASSTGSGNVLVAPWGLGDGTTTFNLPDFKAAGRYRRSRTSTTQTGSTQADQNKSHSHTASASTSTTTSTTTSVSIAGDGSHSHTVSDVGHVHNVPYTVTSTTFANGANPLDYVSALGGGAFSGASGIGNSSNTVTTEGFHNHPGSSASSSSTSGSTTAVTVNADSVGLESRPTTLIVLTCIKT